MTTAAVLTIILAVIFVGTECYSEPRPRPHFTPRGCFQVILECSVPLQQNPFFAGETTDYRVLFNDIDAICRAYESTEECLRPSMGVCDDELQKRINVGFSVGDFLCSDEGKSLLREYKSSVCYTDPTKIIEIQAHAELCFVEAVSRAEGLEDDDARCLILNHIFSCAVSRVTQVCGDATGRLANEVNSRVLPGFTEDECSSESASDILKRSMSFFRGG